MSGSEPAQKVRPSKETEAIERRLIEAAQRDAACFADLYEHFFEQVYAYTARRVRDRAAAEDLTAEVFRKALESLPRFKWTGAPFAAWLFRIASNMLADRARRAEGVNSDSPALEQLSGPEQSQQRELEESEQSARLFCLVNELPDHQRRVVFMRFAEEKSIREIADELGRSEGAVKQLQFRALENLRARLAGQEYQR